VRNVEKELIGCRCGTEKTSCHRIAGGAYRGNEYGSGWGSSVTLSFEPVFDGDATCFVGVSACGSVLSERKRGRKVLVTGGT
jgi:hypothetical protein